MMHKVRNYPLFIILFALFSVSYLYINLYLIFDLIFRRSFRYAYYVTTYPIFQRERRAICTHFSWQIYLSVLNLNYFQIQFYSYFTKKSIKFLKCSPSFLIISCISIWLIGELNPTTLLHFSLRQISDDNAQAIQDKVRKNADHQFQRQAPLISIKHRQDLWVSAM